MVNQTPKILVVDDDEYTLSLLEGLFRDKPMTIRFASDGTTARHLVAGNDFNLILMDQRLPDANGLDLVREFRRTRPQLMAILITGYADVRDAVAAVREGLFDYLSKPFDNLEELEAVVEKALELDRAYREIDDLKRDLEGRENLPVFVGQSRAAEAFLKQLEQVAPLDTTVLLEGESGTGKDIAARILHARSNRAKAPFVEVNCGALSEQLLESTLFGYEKGAFTGADRTSAGCFEDANGGTLFLDEIADMSGKLQSSLLHVLQEHNFSRLGSSRIQRSDFRLICATNRKLAEEVRDGSFREDLFYRINVVAIEVPTLRARREDVVRLAIHFLDRYNAKFNKMVGPFTPEAIARLERFSWPGNVRQLQHAIERLAALHENGPVGADDVDQVTPSESQDPAGNDELRPYQLEREEFERDYLRRLLLVARGNVSEAARISGIARQNLYLKMKRLGVS